MLTVRDLRIDYRKNPIGLGLNPPRFTWKLDGEGNQVSFRLTVHSDTGRLFFDSGALPSRSMHVLYDGPKLLPETGYEVRLSVLDDQGQESRALARFETAPDENGMTARWISGRNTDCRERLPADYFRKQFSAREKPVRARLYATACGVYTAYVNGHRLPGVLAPGSSEYDRRLYYQTYDVTELVQQENTLDFTLGDGWYKGKIGSSNNQYFFGTQTKLLAQLVLTYADGSRQVIGTDRSFFWTNSGHVRYSDLKDGEVYDARMLPEFGEHAVEAACTVKPEPSPHEPILEQEHFSPVVLTSPSGASILDFRQNLAGYIRFALPAHEGQVIRLRMCEALDHGEYSDATVQHPEEGIPEVRQEIVYTCTEGENRFEPEFFYSGFRYALVEGLETVCADWFEAVAVYSDFDFVGSFHSSNTLLNQFVRNTVWSLKSNFVDVPTDCPQREKSAWTGDAQIFARTATYFTNTAAFYRKWLVDMRDCQREDGRVENVSPKIRGVDQRDLLNGSAGWADAAVILPYTLWKMYGDDRFIVENYDLMHGWKEYIFKAAADKSYYFLPDGHPLKGMLQPYLLPDSPYNRYIVESGMHWGEWAEPESEMEENPTLTLVKPKQEVTSAYTHYSMSLLEEMLLHIGKTEEAALCREWAEGARMAYRTHFLRDGQIDSSRQAPYVRAIALGLLEPEEKKAAAAKLNDLVVRNDYKVGTGFLSTPFILGVLAENGFSDTAYRMLENEKAPGWLAMPRQGATTVWEQYLGYDENGSPKKISMNHYSPGAVCAFLFDTVCGIRPDGENRFVIRPLPGGSLQFAEAAYDSIYGKVTSRWERQNGNIRFLFEIPGNTEARIELPDGTARTVSSGRYEMEITADLK